MTATATTVAGARRLYVVAGLSSFWRCSPTVYVGLLVVSRHTHPVSAGFALLLSVCFRLRGSP